MHRCLSVDEIVALICGHLDASNKKDRATLLSTALAARLFTDHALDVLWRQMGAFGPLLRTLPKDLWTMQVVFIVDEERAQLLERENSTYQYMVVDLIRPLRPEDWTRFDFYAKRVRTWAPHSSRNDAENLFFSEAAMNAVITSKRSLPLLPRIQHVELGMDIPYWSPETIQFISGVCLTPNLQSLSISWSTLHIHSGYVASLFAVISQQCPFLQVLRLHGSYGMEDYVYVVQDIMSSFLCSFSALRVVQLRVPISDAAINHIVGLTTLQELDIELDQLERTGASRKPFGNSKDRFPVLSHLTLFSWDPTSICLFLKGLNQRPLHSLRVYFDDLIGIVEPDLPIQAYSDALGSDEALRSSLVDLTILGPRMHAKDATPNDATLPPLNVLFPFPLLQELRIELTPISSFDETWLAMLPNYWPKLRVFEMSGRWSDEETFRGPYFGSVVSLVQQWRDLEEFHITTLWAPFDISPYRDAGAPASRVTKIGQAYSTFGGEDGDVTYVEQVFKCLITAFPNLDRFESRYSGRTTGRSWDIFAAMLDHHRGRLKFS